MTFTLTTLQHLVPIAVVAIVLLACLSLVGYQLRTGVPPLSSSARAAEDVIALLRQAGLAPGAVVYELGSGWGSLAIALARAFPQAEIRGIELSPLPYWVSRLRARTLTNLTLRRANFLDCDLSDAHAVTCYLMIKPMRAIAALLDRSVRPGTPVVSLSFWFRDRQVAASLQRAGLLSSSALYIWPARRDTPAGQS
ncbi:SAM-dependent methyltransferase [Burkholderia sp. Ac-20379]|uniref:SAM-dependent methyltransferase n=1 Tax=Burkholderia sp. Ac-20379 TaxID=2703900 RepID=UPI00197EA6D8|nr:class I SAM-dependent methyltransferase [Burkholderia sp. Ac-20379]MBN3727395.1 class I SAM-dependent methyltransferase [Burkholderia sp. Ac-20379]